MRHGIVITILSLLVAATELSARSDGPYYCTTAGTTLYYERYAAGKNKLIQTTTIEIESVENTGSGKQVNYSLTLRNGNGSPMYGGKTKMTAVIDSKSDLWMDIGASVRELLKNFLKISNVSCSGDMAVVPANMAPGDTLPDSHSVVTAAGIKYNIDVTNRTVLRKDRLTTPCGTFDCVVIREYKAEVGPGRNHCEWSENWYVRDYGYVRHDVYDKNGKLKSSETLISRIPQ